MSSRHKKDLLLFLLLFAITGLNNTSGSLMPDSSPSRLKAIQHPECRERQGGLRSDPYTDTTYQASNSSVFKIITYEPYKNLNLIAVSISDVNYY